MEGRHELFERRRPPESRPPKSTPTLALLRRTRGGRLVSHCRRSQRHDRHGQSPSGRREASCDRRCRDGVRPALSRACTILTLNLGETHATRRVLERTTPIDTRPTNGGAGSIDREGSLAGRQVRGVDGHVVIARIREHHRRDDVRSPKWFATNVRQVCDRVVGRPAPITPYRAFRNRDAELQ